MGKVGTYKVDLLVCFKIGNSSIFYVFPQSRSEPKIQVLTLQILFYQVPIIDVFNLPTTTTGILKKLSNSSSI